MADIQQFIYTKVPKEKSPWNKNGFQTLYYPVGTFDRKTILDIESRIHFPGDGFDDLKRSIFFLEINGETQMVMVYLQPLPDTLDEFGRKGMFLAHGFVLPKSLWEVSPYPLAWNAILDAKRAKTFDSIFTLPGVDAEKGTLPPISASPKDVEQAHPVLPNLNADDIRLLEVLYKIGKGLDDKISLVMKGEPQEVEARYNRIIAWLPEKIRLKAGFDPAFDGGKIFFFPLRAFGYNSVMPVTADPIRFDLASSGFSSNAPTTVEEPFVKWAMVAKSVTTEMVEKAYQLSAFLDGTLQEIDPNLQPPAKYAEANEATIRATFADRSSGMLHKEWAKYIATHANPTHQLQLLMSQLPVKDLATFFEDSILAIEEGETTPWPQPVQDNLVAEGGPVLRAMDEIWRKKQLSKQYFNEIPPTQQEPFMHMLGKSHWKDKTWMFPLVTRKSPAHAAVLSNTALNENAINWIKSETPRPWSKLDRPFFVFVLEYGALDEYEKEEVDWALMLDNYLIDRELPYEEAVKVTDMALDQQLNAGHTTVLKHFMAEETAFPPTVGNSEKLRQYFIATRILVHNLSIEKLKKSALTKDEISFATKISPSGLKKLFRKLFG